MPTNKNPENKPAAKTAKPTTAAKAPVAKSSAAKPAAKPVAKAPVKTAAKPATTAKTSTKAAKPVEKKKLEVVEQPVEEITEVVEVVEEPTAEAVVEVSEIAEEAAVATAEEPTEEKEEAEKEAEFKRKKVERVAANKAQRAKRRNTAVVIVLCVIIVAVSLVALIPQLNKEKADDMLSASLSNSSIKMFISSSGYPTNTSITIQTSHLATPGEEDAWTRKLIDDDSETYTVVAVNYDAVRGMSVLDIPNDTVLMTVVKGDIKNVAMGDIPEPEEINITMGDFFDFEGIKEQVDEYGELVEYSEYPALATWSSKLLQGTKFGSFAVVEGSVIKGRGSNVFTLSNRNMLYITLTLSQYDAYNIIREQNALAADEDLDDKYVTADVIFSYPYGILKGKVMQVSEASNGYYAVVVQTEVPLTAAEGTTLSVDTFLPQSSVTVKINTGEESGLCAPVKAIYTEDGRDFVLIRKGKNNLQRVYINVKISNGVSAIIEAADPADADLLQSGGEVFYEKEQSLLPF